VKTINGDVRDQLKTLNGDVRYQLKAINLTLTGLKANVMRLCARNSPPDRTCKPEEPRRRGPEPNAYARGIFESADVKIAERAKPEVASQGIKQQLPQVAFTADPGQVKTTDKPAA
jgi:hypothetical protein